MMLVKRNVGVAHAELIDLKNNSHLALLTFIQNALTYNAYARLLFERMLPSNIAILFQIKNKSLIHNDLQKTIWGKI